MKAKAIIKPMQIKTKKELMEVLKKIPYKDKEHRNRIICSLIGHSMIQTLCWNYYSCGRCGMQLGDNLASTYLSAPKVVIIGHNCKQCRANYKKCTWKDKLYVENPFTKKRKKK